MNKVKATKKQRYLKKRMTRMMKGLTETAMFHVWTEIQTDQRMREASVQNKRSL